MSSSPRELMAGLPGMSFPRAASVSRTYSFSLSPKRFWYAGADAFARRERRWPTLRSFGAKAYSSAPRTATVPRKVTAVMPQTILLPPRLLHFDMDDLPKNRRTDDLKNR